MNKIILIGNLARDPEAIRAIPTKNGSTEVCSFTIAVSRRHASKDAETTTDFFQINAWGNKAKSCHDYLSKGKKVFVSGELGVRMYTGKDGKTRVSLDVHADEVEFLTPKGDPIASDPVQVRMDEMKDISSDDIPF